MGHGPWVMGQGSGIRGQGSGLQLSRTSRLLNEGPGLDIG